MSINILDRYFLKFFIKSFLGAIVLLTGIGLIAKVNETLKNFLGIEGAQWLIIKYYALSIPAFITYIIPPALMFSVAFTVANFKKSNEISVILAAGRSFRRTLMPLVIFSIFLSGAFFVFNEFIAYPFAYKAYDTRDIIQKNPNLRYDRNNRNISVRFNDRYYTIGKLDILNKSLVNLHLLEYTTGNFPKRIVECETATYKANEWILQNGSITNFNPDGSVQEKNYFKFIHAKPNTVHIKEKFADIAAVHTRNTTADERSIFLILELLEAKKKTGGDYHFLETEFYWHLGYPLICFFVTFIGGSLGSQMRHAGIAVSIGLAMVFTIVYFFIMYFGTALGETGVLPPFLAANLANIGSFAFTIYLYFKQDY